MKVLGSKIRRYRMISQRSQTELARGICTQATVSLIESRGQCTNVKILGRICQRLNLKLSQVVVNHRTCRQLLMTEKQLLSRDYEAVRNSLKSMIPKRFDYTIDKLRYYCYFGWLEFRFLKKDDEALYYFNRGLAVKSIQFSLVYRAWCELGISRIYLAEQKTTRMNSFLEASLYDLKMIDLPFATSHFYLAVQIEIGIIRDYQKLGAYRLSNQIAKTLTNRLRRDHSMYRLNSIYLLMAKNNYCLKRHSEALTALNRSRTLSHIYQDQRFLDRINLLQTSFENQVLD